MKLTNIKTLVVKKGMTCAQLADKVGVSPVTLSRWINGTFEPTYDTLKKVCDALQASATEVLGF